MASAQFRIPSSSIEEIRKIVKGYAHLGENVELPNLARLLSLHKTVISPNHPFLVEIGIIVGGKKKSVTPLGQRLGRAWEHEQDEEVQDALRQLVGANDALNNLVTTLRLKGGMSTEEFSKHILYAASLPNNPRNRTGARTVVDLLIEARLITETDGRLVIAKSGSHTSKQETQTPSETRFARKDDMAQPTAATTPPPNIQAMPRVHLPSAPVVSINIELKIPATDNPDVYENFFKSMKKHLWAGETDGE